MLDKPFVSPSARGSDGSAFAATLWRGGAELVLDVAFVNNMPDGAFEATERQFTRLLSRGAAPARVRMRRFMFPERKAKCALPDFDLDRYESTDSLRALSVDALVVTGSEPVRPHLRDEDYWPSLRRLVEWASGRTISALWSCLAAHAAVFELDGIERTPLATKRSGVFESEIVSAHPIVRDCGACVAAPHSRWNELQESVLRAAGYEILTCSPEAGVDLFLKEVGSLFLFLQGHPEYDLRSLLLEFRRDLKRYVDGERSAPPAAPRHYFEPETQSLLKGLAEAETEARRRAAARNALRAEWRTKPAAWAGWSEALFQNWLSYVAEEKARRREEAQSAARAFDVRAR